MAAVQEADSLLLKDGHGDLTPSKRRHRVSQHISGMLSTGIPAWAAIELSRATRGCRVQSSNFRNFGGRFQRTSSLH